MHYDRGWFYRDKHARHIQKRRIERSQSIFNVGYKPQRLQARRELRAEMDYLEVVNEEVEVA